MGKDITDVMLEGLFELIGWIASMFMKFAWWIIVGIFGLIIGWFAKKKGENDRKRIEE
ncbi:hypothetical protein [Bacteroides sp. 519]|uniref:hypothetical protein n=1 Tax=Bacteroides sp. 519 TaxID=2302937 RepID=UPI0013D398F8|nr:hypothetical protein [Bacteroides sp. 519]